MSRSRNRILTPDLLKSGDEVRVIAPSRSLNVVSEENREIANGRLKELGLKVTFGSMRLINPSFQD